MHVFSKRIALVSFFILLIGSLFPVIGSLFPVGMHIQKLFVDGLTFLV